CPFAQFYRKRRRCCERAPRQIVPALSHRGAFVCRDHARRAGRAEDIAPAAAPEAWLCRTVFVPACRPPPRLFPPVGPPSVARSADLVEWDWVRAAAVPAVRPAAAGPAAPPAAGRNRV